MFICALPRSRTAWLANFLTYGAVTFHHELISEVTGVDDFINRLRDPNVGNADCLQSAYMDKILMEIGPRPIVIIQRDVLESIKASKAAGFGDLSKTIIWLDAELAQLRETHNCLLVEYNEINQKIRQIWDYLRGDEFPEERWEALKYMKVEMRRENFGKLLKQKSGNVARFQQEMED